MKKILTDIIESGHETADEVRMLTQDDRNNFNWFNIHAQKTLIDNSIYIVLVCLDIHHIKISESRLSTYKKWLIKAMDAGNAGVWDWNIVTNAGMWSSNLWDIFGIEKRPGVYPTSELWLSAIHPDDRERIVDSLKRALSLQKDLSAEYRVLRPDGSCRWILESARPVFDKKGEVKRYCGIAIDITEQKKFENEITLIRKNIDALLQKFHIGWFHLNLNDHSVTRTIEHARIFGYDNLDAEWSFEKFLEHVVDEDRERVKKILAEMLLNHKDFTTEYHIRKANGNKRKILSSGSFVYDDLGKPSHLVGILQDITDMQNDE
jgi:PAS domain S-box-containing protein